MGLSQHQGSLKSVMRLKSGVSSSQLPVSSTGRSVSQVPGIRTRASLGAFACLHTNSGDCFHLNEGVCWPDPVSLPQPTFWGSPCSWEQDSQPTRPVMLTVPPLTKTRGILATLWSHPDVSNPGTFPCSQWEVLVLPGAPAIFGYHIDLTLCEC